MQTNLHDEARPREALVRYEREGGSSLVLHFRYTKSGEVESVAAPDIAALLQTLSEVAAGHGGLQYLHPRVVAHGPRGEAWWRPAWKAPLYFTLPALEDLSGQTFPQPPLLFIAMGGNLRVFALPENRRPEPDTPLLHAPYFNLYEYGVCEGTGRRGKDPEDWESAFFESAFSHLGSIQPLKQGSLVDLWRGLVGEEMFPIEVLRETGKSLEEVL